MIGESRVRLICIAAFFSLCFAALGLRLIEVTLIGGGDLPFKRLVMEPQLMLASDDDVDVSKVANKQRSVRHEVVDRNGMVLATTIQTASLVANPNLIRDEAMLAKQLHKIFPRESAASFYEKLMRKRSNFLYLQRHLAPSQQEAVNNLGIPGLFFEPDMRRVYPYGALFSHTLGYVGVDNDGLAGIEKNFNERLRDGSNDAPLTLSLDLRVQSIMRDELAKAVANFNAIGAMGVILDVTNGEIIAISSLPEFNPNQPGRANENAMFNRATLGVYEMGSTFKAFTAAAALDAGVVGMRGGYDASSPIHEGGFTISDAHPEGRWLTVGEIIAYSSNIGAAKMALDVGGKQQREFLKSLGLFDPIKLEIPEVGRPIIPRDWSRLTTMTVSYGHGISVSPLHLIRAVAAVTGDGKLRPLTLVKDGNANRPESAPVVKEKTIANMRDIMRLVVRFGTAKSAEAAGYWVGGKTGTAEKNSGGVYNKDAKVASFVGVFPVNQPRYAILVMVDEPKGNKSTYGFATGGWVSAPVVGRVVQRMAPLIGMQPDFAAHDKNIEALWMQAGHGEQVAQSNRLAIQPKAGTYATSF
jgi:cell division protein FtsI (penicillin-binding protein 3)